VSSWLFVVLALAPEPSAANVGVVWYDEATVAPAAKQRLVAGLRARSALPIAVIPDALERARRVVAEEIPRAVVERQIARTRALDDAEAAYRAGRLAGALGTALHVQTDLRAEPIAPGTAHLLARSHLLVAQIHWTEGDATASDAALSAAIVLDPSGHASPRRLPPELVERHAALQKRVLEDRSRTWIELGVFVHDEGAEIEIDGIVGARPVPPGEHVVVVRRPGALPVAAIVATSWNVPLPQVELGPGLPRNRGAAERMCDALDLQRIVLARKRGERFGVQGYECGAGYGPPWFGDEPKIAEGAASALGIGVVAGFDADVVAIASARPWPKPAEVTTTTPGKVDTPPKKPWYKRAWIWTIIGGVVVAGVVTGAVLGTRAQDGGVGVDADSFLRP
jgi:hypothetical protein